MNRKEQYLIIGAAKPWEVKKLLTLLDKEGHQYSIFTIEQYKGFFNKTNIYSFGIRSPFNFLKIIKAVKTFYKQYDEVIIVNIFPYNFTYKVITIISFLFSKKGKVILWHRGKKKNESLFKHVCSILPSFLFNILLIPLWLIVPLLFLISIKMKACIQKFL